MRQIIFVDAGPLRAIVTPRDQWSTKTQQLLRKSSPQTHQLVTSEYVINEVFTGLMGVKNTGYQRIEKFNTFVFEKESILIEWITKERFYKTKKLFLKVSKDKKWSFTDCTSYVVMKELGIKTTFTFDEHFKQMGFKLLGE